MLATITPHPVTERLITLATVMSGFLGDASRVDDDTDD
jgi:hypothetical protein